MIKIIKDDIFKYWMVDENYVINPVNCVGIMGKGLAYEFKLKSEEHYKKYLQLCKK